MTKYNQQDQTLNKIKDIIVKTVSPNKVILFGSRARGEAKSDSDYDILVIKDNLTNERVLTRKINYELISEDIDPLLTNKTLFPLKNNDLDYETFRKVRIFSQILNDAARKDFTPFTTD